MRPGTRRRASGNARSPSLATGTGDRSASGQNSRPLVRFETTSVGDSITIKVGFDDDVWPNGSGVLFQRSGRDKPPSRRHHVPQRAGRFVAAGNRNLIRS